MQQVEIDRATIITSAEKGSPCTGFSADFSQKNRLCMRAITILAEECAWSTPTSPAHAAESRAANATNTSRAGPAMWWLTSLESAVVSGLISTVTQPRAPASNIGSAI